MAWCSVQQEGNVRVPSTSGKTRLVSKYYVGTRGWGMRKHHPRGCCGNPGICLIHAQGQKKIKGLPRATHCTDHAQNLRQRDPNGRIVPTPSDVSDKGASTKRCARRKKENGKYTYTYKMIPPFVPIKYACRPSSSSMMT